MVEPALYDKYYDSIEDISELISGDIEARTNDEVDGEIYRELLKDLRVDIDNRKSEKVVTKALPLFMDYGILYYRSDITPNPPRTWSELSSVKDWIYFTDFSYMNTIYAGTFNEDIEFFYNLIENVLNTNEKLITYNVTEKEIKYTIEQYKKLFDAEILDEYAYHLNSDYGVKRFNDERMLYLRNWSSYLYNVTTTFSRNEPNKNGVKKTFGIAKILYSNDRSKGSKAINKGFYLGVVGGPDGKKKVDVPTATKVVQTFSSKEFMKKLVEYDEFYDIPAYHSLLENDASINNKKYCERISCNFFRNLAEDQIVAAYDAFYQKEFLQKLSKLHEICLAYFKSDDTVSINDVMSQLSGYFLENNENTIDNNTNLNDNENNQSNNENVVENNNNKTSNETENGSISDINLNAGGSENDSNTSGFDTIKYLSFYNIFCLFMLMLTWWIFIIY